MITFTTTITAMYTLQKSDPNYVVNVFWLVTGVNGSNTASIGGNTTFNFVDQEGPVTPYASLTQAQVIGWISKSSIMSAQDCVQGQIDDMITPPVSPVNSALPWSQA